MTINIEVVNDFGFPYNLLTNLINFDKIQLGETKRFRVSLKNQGRATRDVKVKAIRHPTAQIGPADQTYNSCMFGLSDVGPWYAELDIPLLVANEVKYLWVQWYMPLSAIPGYSQFAMEAKGVTDI